AHPDPGNRPPRHKPAAETAETRRPDPAEHRIENPSTKMIGEPAPWLVVDERPAEKWIHKPETAIEGRPTEADSVRPPAISIAGDWAPRTIGIQVGQTRRIVGRIDILLGSRGCISDAINAAGDPAIKIVVFRSASNADGRVVIGAHRKGLAFGKFRGFVLAANGDAALGDIHSAAIIEIVDAEVRAIDSLDREVSTGDAEIITAAGVDVKRSGALPQDKAGGLVAVICQREIVELENRVLCEKGHRTVLEFHFGAPLVCGEDVALANRQVEFGSLPRSFPTGRRDAMYTPSKTHRALGGAERDYTGARGVRAN